MRGQKGITLVALVVTIVVLLILAGITITYVLSDGGILNKAKESKASVAISDVKDNVALALKNVQIEVLTNAKYNEPAAEAEDTRSTLATKDFKDALPTDLQTAFTRYELTYADGNVTGAAADITYKGVTMTVTITSFDNYTVVKK